MSSVSSHLQLWAGEEDVAAVVSQWTGVPLKKMLATEAHKAYPAEKLPSLLVYHAGGIVEPRLFGLAPYGGVAGLQARGAAAIALRLADSGAIDTAEGPDD